MLGHILLLDIVVQWEELRFASRLYIDLLRGEWLTSPRQDAV